MVEVHSDKMDDDDVHSFLGKHLLLWDEIHKGKLLFKCWVVPGKDPKSAYLAIKHFHQISDGTSMMQMLSLMQDGGDAVTKGPNQIYYP